jgi:hypothetical protein
MELNKINTDMIPCIRAVISKCRASLTAEEVEMLEDVIRLLQQIGQKEHLSEKRLLALSVVLKILGFLLQPEVCKKIRDLFDQFL